MRSRRPLPFLTPLVSLIVLLLLGASLIAQSEPDAAGDESTASSIASGADGSTWAQWRGPTRDSRYHGATWPTSIGERSLVEQWRVAVGPGYASPIVSADRVFTVETKEKETEIVRAFDRATGKQLWETSWAGSMKVPFFAARNGSWVRSTPALDGDSLYVGGMRDFLVCLDANTGDVRWAVDFVKRYGGKLPAFGFVSSPLVLGDHVYVQAGGGFVKLDKTSGKSVWRVLVDGGGMYGSAFSSPVVAEIGGRKQLLVQARETLNGVSPDDGKVYWTRPIKAMRGMNILTPSVYDDAVFTTANGGESGLYRVESVDGGETVRRAWKNKLQGYMSSPCIVDDHAYLHLKNRRFSCIDLKSGAIDWITKERFGGYWSMASQGDRMLALDQRGTLMLIRANPERFELIEKRKLTDAETWAHLAVVDGWLFVRELNAIVAYRWRRST